jgi:23S rRNA pseudouridine2605 synthase
MTEIRLQKVLAQAGVSSRRGAEEFIRQGRVSVNGKIVKELGTTADPELDEIRLDGKPIAVSHRKEYLLFYKPKFCVTTLSDPQGRQTVMDYIPDTGLRLFPVGRLDYDAEGLLLMTNDGPLSNRLQHPRYGVHKSYEVKVQGHPDDRALQQLRSGVRLEDGVTAPAEVALLKVLPKAAWIRVVLHQGWNRQIKRMGEAVGHPVLKIRRVAYGPLTLGNLKPGSFRKLDRAEVQRLYQLVQLDETQGEK